MRFLLWLLWTAFYFYYTFQTMFPICQNAVILVDKVCIAILGIMYHPLYCKFFASLPALYIIYLNFLDNFIYAQPIWNSVFTSLDEWYPIFSNLALVESILSSIYINFFAALYTIVSSELAAPIYCKFFESLPVLYITYFNFSNNFIYTQPIWNPVFYDLYQYCHLSNNIMSGGSSFNCAYSNFFTAAKIMENLELVDSAYLHCSNNLTLVHLVFHYCLNETIRLQPIYHPLLDNVAPIYHSFQWYYLSNSIMLSIITFDNTHNSFLGASYAINNSELADSLYLYCLNNPMSVQNICYYCLNDIIQLQCMQHPLFNNTSPLYYSYYSLYDKLIVEHIMLRHYDWQFLIKEFDWAHCVPSWSTIKGLAGWYVYYRFIFRNNNFIIEFAWF